MRVWIYEANLLWSVRLTKGAEALGHEATVVESAPAEAKPGDRAIVNLGDPEAASAIAGFKAAGVRTIGHTGHREAEFIALGEAAGCDVITTNGELSHKLGDLLAGA